MKGLPKLTELHDTVDNATKNQFRKSVETYICETNIAKKLGFKDIETDKAKSKLLEIIKSHTNKNVSDQICTIQCNDDNLINYFNNIFNDSKQIFFNTLEFIESNLSHTLIARAIIDDQESIVFKTRSEYAVGMFAIIDFETFPSKELADKTFNELKKENK